MKSIRARLFVTFGTLTACVCLVFAGLTWLFAAVTEDDVINQVVDAEARYILRTFEETNNLPEPRVDYIQIYTDVAEFPAQVQDQIRQSPKAKEYSINGRNYHIEQYALNSERGFWLVIDASQLIVIYSISEQIGWFVLIATLIMLILALWIAKKLSNRTALPIEQLTQQIHQHTPGSTFHALVSNRVDEIGQLGQAFEQLLHDVETLLERERNFTRDVSHELRTPLALLNNTLVLADKKALNDKDKAVIQQVSESLHNTVEVLLALARSENMVGEIVDIKPILERSVLLLLQSHNDQDFNVSIDISDAQTVYGNPRLIELLCQNLINNGYYHGGAKAMQISCSGNTLTFKNPAGRENDGTYQGLGHGKYLVQRIASALSWQVDFDQHDNHYVVHVNMTPSSS
ncbi:HAMP domain-containing protein [Alteromonas facilis]|uniref:HAMP domain-containing protein n=1 Tax=Alteromonas facilis TaxID=2048004 RepID=UPI000C28236F|nr:HAMP domain-containing protein [Alteromonas facilis]